MTTDKHVKKQVLDTVRKITPAGNPVTKTLWKVAYNIVRCDAIREIVEWKDKYITIGGQSAR